MSITEVSSRVQDDYRSAPDRTPPQDNDAEQSVLGAMLLSKDAIADVLEVLRGTDFYRPAHETVYDAVLDLYGRGEPADAVTVSALLQRRGELGRVGGAPYLHTLVAGVPIAANAGYYAEIVREKAILRRLVDAGTRIVQMGYAGHGEIDEVVDRAQAEVYDVTEKRSSEDYAPLSEIMEAALDEIEAIGNRDGEMVGVPTGFSELDDLTNGLHPGQLVVIAARPAIGKSTLALDFARAASIVNDLPTVIFSLEMTRNEITMRLLSAEARIPLHHMRNGHMSDDDWSRLARKMGEVSNAPLFIDDSPNMTMMEIRAKARRLRQRHGLKLIVLDYLQLMQSGKRVESRQVEVSEFSRNLKLLAKELSVPVVALSQLNRGSEQRADKRPMLSDLRECLSGDTLITRSDTGQPVPIRDLVGQQDFPVWTLDERLRLRRGVMSDAWCTGTKPVYRLSLASGRQVSATQNHPFLTLDGWQTVGALEAGDSIAVARAIPELAVSVPQHQQGWSVDVSDRDDDIDVIPASAWQHVRKAMPAHGVTDQALAERLGMASCGSALYKSGLSRARMSRVAAAVPDAYLFDLATSDVRWARITSIEALGDTEVYDAHVPGTHSFLANEVISHNSGAIEQDSDMVILLHREDAYEKESVRSGEADLIVAKHRNGPTKDVTVAFQGHYSRFVDMAHG
ncbi:MAG: replicative DNA helicase [Actinomycetota bacterium]|nr:replicative DNA helicase [Actinomycetota bacterium]